MGKRASLRQSVPRARELDAKTCLSKDLHPHPFSCPWQGRATPGTGYRVHVWMGQGSPHPFSTGELDCLSGLHISFEPSGSAVSVHTLTLCGRHAIRMGSTSRISLILEPPFPIRDPHWLAGTTSRNVTGGLLVAGLLLMELMMS